MSLPVSTIPDKERPEAKTLSIEIEPSPSIILAMVQLFKTHNRPRQAVELCQMGLNYFPQDMGLRLGTAMAYLDLKEKDKAWSEIMAVALELKNLAPTMENISEYSRKFGEPRLSEWFSLVSNTLAKYPEESQEISMPPPVLEKIKPEDLETPLDSPAFMKEPSFSSPAPNKDDTERGGNVKVGSNVLSSLNDWLSQLKGDKA